MDNYHIPYGEGSNFSSWARLSISWVRSSSPDWDVGGNAFFRHRQSYFDLFLPKFQKFLRSIFCFTFRWFYILISSRIRGFSTNLMRVSMDGVDDFSSSFSDFFWLKILTYEHCLSFGLKANLSFCPLMLSWISPTPASMCAFVIIKNGLPNMRGVLVSTSMLRMTKLTGTKKFRIFIGISSVIPTGWRTDWSSCKHMAVGASAWWLSLS